MKDYRKTNNMLTEKTENNLDRIASALESLVDTALASEACLGRINDTLKEIEQGVPVTVVNTKTRIPVDVDFPSEVHVTADLGHNDNPIRVRHYPEV
tara:strand:- start:4667 stop:4957 length:291 start_codon:yes stop_codon:yes gene_type:complete